MEPLNNGHIGTLSAVERLSAFGRVSYERCHCNGRVFLLQVQYLRKFGKLQTLALKGNPLAEHSDYVSHVVAFIPSVVYIDFRIVTQDEVRTVWGGKVGKGCRQGKMGKG